MLPRRSFVMLGGCLALPAGVLAATGCNRAQAMPSSCTDTTGLSDDERAMRSTLSYVDRSSAPDRACKGCQQWSAPPEDGECGHCKLLKGPIHPMGSCKAFAPKS
jgi:hypothetical protein